MSALRRVDAGGWAESWCGGFAQLDDGSGGAERGGKRHDVRNGRDADKGRRVARSCVRAGATPAREPLFFSPTKEANPQIRRTDQDFTQLSVIRSTNARREESTDWNGARVEGVPSGEGNHPKRQGDGLRML